MFKPMLTSYAAAVTVVLASLLAIALPARAQQEPLCGPEIKQEIAAVLDQAGYHKAPLSEASVELKQKLYEEFSFCAGYGHPNDYDENPREFCGDLSFVADTRYERMRCCGYDPQKKLFACPVEIKLPYGFGPAHFPGSYEYVLNCVDFGGGFVPVARDRVHLADEIYGYGPDWHFAVVAKAKERLASLPLKGQTLIARSILSWNTMPTGCYDEKLIWGNAIDYQIRLDP